MQESHSVRFEWGANGLLALEHAEAVVIVDVLSFSTCVDIAVSGGCEIYPFAYKDARAQEYADSVNAVLSHHTRSKVTPSLSAASLLGDLPPRLVLPSPNGSELTTQAGDRPCFTACLRNAEAIAQALIGYASVAIIAAGERWPDGSLRCAIEDLLGAGAVIHYLQGSRSPEAVLASNAFLSSREHLHEIIRDSTSGQGLTERGFEEDVELATNLNCSSTVPILKDRKYIRQR